MRNEQLVLQLSYDTPRSAIFDDIEGSYRVL